MMQMLPSCCTYYPSLVTDIFLPCHVMHVNVRRDEKSGTVTRGEDEGRGGGCNGERGGAGGGAMNGKEV